ncbi:hypothetical protein J7T55_004185 [Diaporthe amygdali]|uniref:uncharacterized protein n=1 Tax=Phomopsis amygdali TaxID=1214568 RepID=UPI0022FDB4D6|nr:uncharacterized protein J7T55_004185 [Diaporthe amygdali]KAJ0116015.1 hypothetical protein J7T55_004185 [Diaporthe amygdali]
MASLLIWLWLAVLTAPCCGDYISRDYQFYNSGELGHRPSLKFITSEEYSPVLQVNTWNESAISDKGSHIFIRHDGEPASPLSSPLILDARDLTTVFVDRKYANVFGTRVQENFGKRYLTFWAGKKGYGLGDGFGLVFDANYRLAYNVSAQGIALHSDLHEFALTGHGTALVTGVEDVLVDTAGWKDWQGPAAFPVLDALFQEIDLETNEVLFSWRALDHISPLDSFETMAKDWDAFHLNSVQKTHAGNYLISIRHTSSVMLINGTSGDVIWTLGGKRNDFTELAPPKGVETLNPVLTMGWQHHARFVPHSNETEMTLFDNHVKTTSHGKCRATCSRGLHIAIDDTSSPPTVQLLREYLHPSHLQAQSQGSVQVLPTASDTIENVFIGWGRCPSFTEHTASGATVMDVQFSPWHSDEIPNALDNYRAYKMDWVATPHWDPALAIRENPEGNLSVYVSWNGATEVREWVVRGGTGGELARSPRTGFETRLTANGTGLQRLWADALDSKGTVLRSTQVLDLVHGNVTILADSKEPDWTFTEPPRSTGISAGTWALMGGGLLGLILVSMGGKMLWRRQRAYDRLDDDDSDLDSDTDVESVFGMDHFSNELPPEPWQEFASRSAG